MSNHRLVAKEGSFDSKAGEPPLRDGEHKSFTGWGSQGKLSLRDMSLSDDKILERGTQGIIALRDMFLIEDKILKRGTQQLETSS